MVDHKTFKITVVEGSMIDLIDSIKKAADSCTNDLIKMESDRLKIEEDSEKEVKAVEKRKVGITDSQKELAIASIRDAAKERMAKSEAMMNERFARFSQMVEADAKVHKDRAMKSTDFRLNM